MGGLGVYNIEAGSTTQIIVFEYSQTLVLLFLDLPVDRLLPLNSTRARYVSGRYLHCFNPLGWQLCAALIAVAVIVCAPITLE